MKIDFRVLIIGIAALLVYSQVKSQPYASIGFTNKGVNGGIGMLAGGIDLNLSYDQPMARVDKPALLAFSVSRNFILGDRDAEENHWSMSGGIGYVNCTYKDLSTFDTDGKMTKVSEFRPLYRAEIGWNANIGKIAFVTKRCEKMYYGFVMTCFFYR